jgi:putative methyltransferase (TIGR04325 family)
MDGSKLARDLLPPLLYRALTAVNPNAISLVGPYADWAAAVADSQGYHDATIVQQVEQAQDRVLAGEASFERDSVLFQDPQYNCPLMALLLRAALENKGRLSVLDFGGALGSTWLQHRNFLLPIQSLNWTIIEQAGFVAKGRSKYSGDVLQFHHSLDEAVAAGVAPDVVLLCSVLQYLEHPQEVLEQILALRVPYLFIERTPFNDQPEPTLMVQKVPGKIGAASYPSWILGRPWLLDLMLQDYEPLIQASAAEGVVGVGRHAAHYQTMAFRRRDLSSWQC